MDKILKNIVLDLLKETIMEEEQVTEEFKSDAKAFGDAIGKGIQTIEETTRELRHKSKPVLGYKGIDLDRLRKDTLESYMRARETIVKYLSRKTVLEKAEEELKNG